MGEPIMTNRWPLRIAMAASLVFHAIVLLLCSLVVWRSARDRWVAFTDITVIGVAPQGEGLGMKSHPVTKGTPAIPKSAPPAPAKEKGIVQLPASQGPSAEALAAVRAAFPIGSETPPAAETAAVPAFPDVEGYGFDPGRPGVPWGRPGVVGPLAQRAIKYQVLPPYPAWARQQGITAKVEVGIWVTPEGKVKDRIDIIKKSGWRELDELVLAAVRRWEFEPLPPIAKQEDQYGIVPIRFALTDK